MDTKGGKIAIYARFSTQEQANGTSLDVQLESCRNYILSQGWSHSNELTFVDDGYSGGSLDRPAMKRLREIVKRGKVDGVIVFKLDRLSRSVIDTVNLVMDEWDGKAFVMSAREPIDTTSAMGKQFFYILASFAEWERSVITERTTGGRLQRAKEGRNPGFQRPYGYAKGDKPGTFVIVQEEKPVVERVFREYLAGKGSAAIANGLNQDGFAPRHGRGWRKNTVMRIIENPVYTGKLSYGKTARNPNKKKDPENETWMIKGQNRILVESAFIEPIISQTVWDRAQKLRASKNVKLTGVSGRVHTGEHLLTGMLRCGRCGNSLHGDKQQPGDNFAYYKCDGRRAKGASFCDCGFIRKDILDDFVIGKVREKFLTPAGMQELRQIIRAVYDEKITELNASRQTAGKEIESLEAQAARLDSDYRNQRLDAETYSRLSRQISGDITAARGRITGIESELEGFTGSGISAEMVDYYTSKVREFDALPPEEKKAVLRYWIERIEVEKDRGRNSTGLDVKIVWKWDAAMTA